MTAQVEDVGRADDILGVDLWVENAQVRYLIAMTDDGVCAMSGSDLIFSARHDITLQLIERGRRPLSDNHGLFLFFANWSKRTRRILLGDYRVGSIAELVSMNIEPTMSREDLIGRVVRLLGRGGLPEPSLVENLFRPLMEKAPTRPSFRVHSICAGSETPRLTIVVPLFRECYFLRSLLTMQLNFGSLAEWIFVCDDPNIHMAVLQYLRGHTKLCRGRTTLILNDENYGYSTANTIGTVAAKCKYLLFMNSDIWVDDPHPIVHALERLERGDFGAIGFRLLYEDGTVQHDGMTFERRNELHGLFAVEHPGKGLPPVNTARDIVPVTAVTGALLMTSGDMLERVGGFSKDYILGDFEDADLCLKITRQGQRVGLLRDGGLYHLERQSIRKLGTVDYRQTVTYLNCIRFNQIWTNELAEFERLRPRVSAANR